ncbi:MAG TPA: hypothetical protein VN222_08535 [Novosphingobium sp.]|nr:hypothetical protein [Novosphingobium sp.]
MVETMEKTTMADTASTSARKSAEDGFIPADSDNISLFPQQVVDNMMHVLIALGAEMWTMRRRMMVMEKVMEEAGVSSDRIELYTPTPEEKAAWEEERNIFIQRTFGALTRKGGANAKQMDMSRM